MLALYLYFLRPLLYGLRRFSPPPRCSAELKQTKPLSPRFATSLPYRRRLCRSSSKTFPRFWQLYGFLISILGSPPPGQALKADPPTPPLGLPPRGLPPGAPLRVIYYIVLYRIQGRQVGKKKFRWQGIIFVVVQQGRFVYVYRVGSCTYRVGSYTGLVHIQYQFVAVRSKGQIRVRVSQAYRRDVCRRVQV